LLTLDFPPRVKIGDRSVPAWLPASLTKVTQLAPNAHRENKSPARAGFGVTGQHLITASKRGPVRHSNKLATVLTSHASGNVKSVATSRQQNPQAQGARDPPA